MFLPYVLVDKSNQKKSGFFGAAASRLFSVVKGLMNTDVVKVFCAPILKSKCANSENMEFFLAVKTSAFHAYIFKENNWSRPWFLSENIELAKDKNIFASKNNVLSERCLLYLAL